MRRLTVKEWEGCAEPFSLLRASYPHWTPKHRALVSLWVEAMPSPGWFYETMDVFVFERSEDALAYRVWVMSDPFGIEALRFRPRPLEEAMPLLDGVFGQALQNPSSEM